MAWGSVEANANPRRCALERLGVNEKKRKLFVLVASGVRRVVRG